MHLVACLLLTNHALALAHLSREPGIRLRELAEELGVTERAVHRIVSELVEEGYATRHRMGRRNFYEVHADQPLEQAPVDGRTVGDLLAVLLPDRTALAAPG